MAAFAAVTEAALASNKAIQDLVRVIAAQEGIQLTGKPQPGQPRMQGRHRYTRIERPERGVVVADVLNERTGKVRRFRFTREPGGDGIDIEEE